jgi:CBS domain-containing protein
VILPELSLTTPVRAAMTPSVLTLSDEATAADATVLMAEHTIRHVPVIRKRNGTTKIVGLVSERDLFTLQRLTVRQLAVALRRAPDVGSLAAIAANVRRLSHHLVAQGLGAAQLTRLISHLNDQLTVRLLTLACQRFDVEADAFCWLALGSEGRGEQTIATDQDNGIIFPVDRIDARSLLRLADWVNIGLAECGFPLCNGNIMARNSRWCLNAEQWSLQFAEWIDRGNPDSLLASSIFFDFRGIFGNTALAIDLRRDVVARAARNSRFLKQMADNALRNRPPLSSVFESLLGTDVRQLIDLKLNGTVQFVDAARIWALAAGLSETRTVDRFRRLAEVERLPADDVAEWVDAFEFLQLLRLRRQHQLIEQRQADENANAVDTATLSPIDRKILKIAFQQARKLQERLELDYPG